MMSVENFNEIKKTSFWVSQLFILVSTVVGVFLAANQGYQQAVQFENMTSYKENYYLQKSLQYELQDNIAILKELMIRLQDPNYFGAHNESPNFYSLVWENMKYSKTTLGTPPEFLRLAQQFYRNIATTQQKIAKGDISIPSGIKQFQAQIDIIEQQLIPALEKSTEQIKKELDGTSVIL